MSEYRTMSRPEQFTPSSSQEPLVFDTIGQQAPEFSSGAIKGADTLDIAEAQAAVQDALEQTDRFVFPDEKRGHFEISSPDQQGVKVEPSMLDDAWREQVEARRRAAAEEAEAHAEERELTASVSADAQAMAATRDYVTRYGINAE
jgi:hypothetical protein